MTKDLPGDRRVKAYAVSTRLLGLLFEHGRTYGDEDYYDRLKITKGIPKDANILSAEYDHLTASVIFIVEHKSFDIVPEAMMMKQQWIRWQDMPAGAVETRVEIDD